MWKRLDTSKLGTDQGLLLCCKAQGKGRCTRVLLIHAVPLGAKAAESFAQAQAQAQAQEQAGSKKAAADEERAAAAKTA